MAQSHRIWWQLPSRTFYFVTVYCQCSLSAITLPHTVIVTACIDNVSACTCHVRTLAHVSNNFTYLVVRHYQPILQKMKALIQVSQRVNFLHTHKFLFNPDVSWTVYIYIYIFTFNGNKFKLVQKVFIFLYPATISFYV